MATAPSGFGQRERLARTQQQPKGKNNMSAKGSASCSFEPLAKQTVATDHKTFESPAGETQFREDLWREYRLEAIKAGFNTDQATEYASALSPEMGLLGGVSEMAPAGRGWFYQSRVWVAKRTATSGLIRLTRWRKNRTNGRPTAAGTSMFAFDFRTWNAGGKH
jgi:hypothetical protein